LDEGQLLLQRDRLGAQEFLQPHRLQRAGLDPGIVDQDHGPRAGHLADPRDDAAARDRCIRIRPVLQESRQRREFQERRLGIEQQRQPFPRQQLASPGETRPGLGRGRPRARLQPPHCLDQSQHVPAVLVPFRARAREPGVEARHG
jgi:hypothetical protein